MSEAASSRPDKATSSEWKGWLVLFEFVCVFVTLGIGGSLHRDRENLSLWVRIVAVGLLFVSGLLMVLHGVHCVKWRMHIAQFWASSPGGSWFASAPVRHHSHRSVIVGIISVLMGCLLLVAVVGIVVTSIKV